MKSWIPRPPTPSEMGDHDVRPVSTHLKNKKIALLVSGGIAAYKAPTLARELRRHGADVVVFMSEEAKRFVTVDSMSWASNNDVVENLTARSEHLSKDHPFDCYVVAPATYNIINKMRSGIADTPVTSVLAVALTRLEAKKTQILVAPTMHGDFHNSVLESAFERLNSRGVVFIPPRDFDGKHNLADIDTIASYVCAALSKSRLSGQRVLVTAGPTPVPIDNVRRIANRFRGRLGVEIAKELFRRGADVRLILGSGSIEPPSYIDTIWSSEFTVYKTKVLETIEAFSPSIGIFSAAVADYAPKAKYEGKIPSGGSLKTIELVPTEKVIDLVARKFPYLKLLSFKYQENIELETLLEIARARVDGGHIAVVANRGEEVAEDGGQVAYLVSRHPGSIRMTSKPGIARGICDFLESCDFNKMERSVPLSPSASKSGTEIYTQKSTVVTTAN